MIVKATSRAVLALFVTAAAVGCNEPSTHTWSTATFSVTVPADLVITRYPARHLFSSGAHGERFGYLSAHPEKNCATAGETPQCARGPQPDNANPLIITFSTPGPLSPDGPATWTRHDYTPSHLRWEIQPRCRSILVVDAFLKPNSARSADLVAEADRIVRAIHLIPPPQCGQSGGS
jgi:hypothetical protein